MLLMLCPWTASAASREYAEDVACALDRAGLSRKAAAITMGISESLLSEQLACATGKQLSASRLAELPAVFHEELISLRASRAGGVLLRRDLVELLRGAAIIGRRAIVKAALPRRHRRRA